jgi:hypothetical protein
MSLWSIYRIRFRHLCLWLFWQEWFVMKSTVCMARHELLTGTFFVGVL